MYEHNLNSDEFDQYESTRQKFHLKSEEIFEILSSQTDDHDDRLLNYFINNRCQIYEKFLLRLNKSQERLSQKQDQYDDDDFRTGIWSNQGELKYGLWHNCLFTKMKRSSASRLFDRRMTNLNEKLIYFTPNAKIPLKMSELLDERNIFIIPCHNSRNLRDPVFNRINRLPNQSKSIIVRRLPTMEHI
ncbi:hypothetical protein BLA29_008803, partial [Euroglyphus maynei]